MVSLVSSSGYGMLTSSKKMGVDTAGGGPGGGGSGGGGGGGGGGGAGTDDDVNSLLKPLSVRKSVCDQ